MKRLFILILFLNFIFISLSIAQNSLNLQTSHWELVFNRNNQNGLELSGMSYNGNALIPAAQPPLFVLDIEALSQDISLDAASGWQQIQWQAVNDSTALITFSSPADPGAPAGLSVSIFVSLQNDAVEWDMTVNGLDQSSLYLVHFPQIDFAAPGNDHAFVPLYSGKLVDNPASVTGWDFHAHYPDGWESTMQYMAYYNDTYGIYFGMHDPSPHFKYFGLTARDGQTLAFDQIWLAPDTGIAGNDWEMPGVFRWQIFRGDWYDAALIYRNWASHHAAYWPVNDSLRLQRREKMSRTGLWAYAFMDDAADMQRMEQLLREFAAYFDFPVGLLLYNWNYHDRDDDYPAYFPERTGLDSLIAHLHAADTVVIMPYINGRLYDTDLPDYPVRGYPYATKQSDGVTEWTQYFYGNTFAVMCPTQLPWQDTLRYAVGELSGRLMTDAVYLDQIGAAGTVPCFDTTHTHTRGGGNHWFTGYQQLLERTAAEQNSGQFFTTEGGGDFIANRVEGMYVLGWQTGGLVPAYMTVYGGLIDLFGYTTGTNMYGDQRFFGRLGLAASYGIQPGGLTVWIALNQNNMTDERRQALEFVRDLGRMRYRLHPFMSFGRFRRPLQLDGTIPQVSFTMNDRGNIINVSEPAIQHSVWQQGDSICVYFINIRRYEPSSTPGTVNFSFRIDPAAYGMDDFTEMYVITPSGQSPPQNINTDAPIQVSLNDLEMKAYVFKGNLASVTKNQLYSLRLIPNPAEHNFELSGIEKEGQLIIYSLSGQKLVEYIFQPGQIYSVEHLSSGIYLIQLQTKENEIYIGKIIVK